MKRLFIFLSAFIISIVSKAQDYGMGLLYNPEKEAEIPKRAESLSRDLTVLPSSYSLKQYSPTPFNQESYGTCTAWSSAYAAMTIASAVANNWTSSYTIDNEAFSPWYLYTHIKNYDDYNCSKGSYLSDAASFMKNMGLPKKRDYNIACEGSISVSNLRKYKIDSYYSLFSYPQNAIATSNIDLQKIKMAISNKHPVIIASECFGSLSNAREQWSGQHDYFRGYHAMCVVAYDDTKFGEGAFLIQNSWGTGWGNGGFTWFTYSIFKQSVYEAIEIYIAPKTINNNHLLSGSLKLQLSTGEEMRGSFQNGVYKISGEYISGTRYRIYVSNNQPAWVYVIGSDLQNNVSKVFPPNDKISAALTYKSNNIAIPDEKWFIQMDNTVGKDYVCVLYSAEELDINSVINKIRNGYGSFYDKVSNALNGKLASNSEVNFSQNTISFSAQTNKTVVALIAEVVHK
jgi:C1A family cysteine protease